MTNANIIRILNTIAVIAATVGGASTVDGLNLPKGVLAAGLFIAMLCKAVAAELVQVKGESDEAQGITPGQVAGVAAVHEAAAAASSAAVSGATALPPPPVVVPQRPAAPGELPGKVLTVLAFGLVLLGLTACGTKGLAPGGAYAPGTLSLSTNSGVVTTNFVPSQAPDATLYAADATFDLAYTAIDTAFSLEYQNRELLWHLSPSIKHSLDAIRPDFQTVVRDYTTARAAYLANPTPANAGTLTTIITKVKAIAAAASAVAINVPKQ